MTRGNNFSEGCQVKWRTEDKFIFLEVTSVRALRQLTCNYRFCNSYANELGESRWLKWASEGERGRESLEEIGAAGIVVIRAKETHKDRGGLEWTMGTIVTAYK